MTDEQPRHFSPEPAAKPSRRLVPPVLKELDRAMSRTVDAWNRWKKAPPENAEAAKLVIDEAETRLKEAWAKFDAESQQWLNLSHEKTDEE